METAIGDRRTVAILLAPALLTYVGLKIVPVLWSLGLSFFQGNTLTGFEFVGLANFAEFLSDDAARQSVWVSVLFSVLVTIGQVTLGYLLALLYVFVLRRGSTFVRTAVFFPMVLPTVAVALLFRSFVAVGTQQGPVNAGLEAVGIGSVEFLATTWGTMTVAIVMTLWTSMGFYAVLIFTGLLDIPEETIESARVDGARGWQMVRHIVLPLSLPILLSSIIFSFNATLKVFDSLLALNNGGPGTSTSPLTLYMYRTAFEYADYGYGSTIALVLTALCMVFTVSVFRSSRQNVTEA